MESFCIQVPNSSEWLGLVTGALLKLTYNYYWDKDYPNWEQARDAGKAILNSWFERNPCLAEISGESDCFQFPLSSGFIDYYPISPYLDPTGIPDGWSANPFLFAGDLDILAGYHAGDILVPIYPLPVGGDLTVPSLTFNLTGEGEIELHLLTTINGGMAAITVDGEILETVTFDLNADTASAPTETLAAEIVYERKFETTGSHTVEIRFVPVLDDALIPVRAGGGIRSVVLCGFTEMTLDVRQNPENPCILEKTYDGIEWLPVMDASECATNVVADKVTNKKQMAWRVSSGVTQYTVDGNTYITYTDDKADDLGMRTPYPDGVPSGVDAACISAKNAAAYILGIMKELSDGVQLGGSVTSVIAIVLNFIGIIATGGLSSPLAAVALAGAVSALEGNFFNSMFTGEVIDQMTCDLYNAFDEEGTITTDEFATLHDLWASRVPPVWNILALCLNCLGPIGLVAVGLPENGGVTECGKTPCDPCLVGEFDFTVSPYPFDPSMREFQEQLPTYTQGDQFLYPASKWVGGKGYTQTLTKADNAQRYYWINYIKIYLDHAVDMSNIEVDVDYAKPLSSPTGGDRLFEIIIWDASGTQIIIWQGGFRSGYSDGAFTIATPTGIWGASGHTVIPAGSQIRVGCNLQDKPATLGIGPYDGHCYFKKLRIFGTESC